MPLPSKTDLLCRIDHLEREVRHLERSVRARDVTIGRLQDFVRAVLYNFGDVLTAVARRFGNQLAPPVAPAPDINNLFGDDSDGEPNDVYADYFNLDNEP